MSKKSKPSVAIVMGSDSDLKVMNAAAEQLKEFGVESVVDIVSAHRTPDWLYEFASNAEKNGIKVIIAGAGGAAHLPGMIASLSVLPVIGVPINVTALGGVDALYSIVQMPKGIPVATVAIDNAANAALLAVRILGVSDVALQKKMHLYRQSLDDLVQKKRKQIRLK